MIPSVNGLAGTPEPAGLDRETAARVLAALSDRSTSEDRLAALLQQSFRVALLDALSQIPERPGPSPAAPAPSMPSPPARAQGDPADVRAVRSQPRAGEEAPIPALPTTEKLLINDAASRAAVDPRFLGALRRAENGGPGREFGVLSVPAPTYEDQVRLAAVSIRRSVQRFEATGRAAIDPASGRYTDEFIHFFSKRYAPVGAANDPAGLNRHHARNLIRLYAQVASSTG